MTKRIYSATHHLHNKKSSENKQSDFVVEEEVIVEEEEEVFVEDDIFYIDIVLGTHSSAFVKPDGTRHPKDHDYYADGYLGLVPSTGVVEYRFEYDLNNADDYVLEPQSGVGAFHVHEKTIPDDEGEPSFTGGVVIPLDVSDRLTRSGVTRGVIEGETTVDPLILQDILDGPINYYVNLHTKRYPAGALSANLR